MKIKEHLAFAAKTEAEWEDMTRKWEANDYKDFNPDYQTRMQYKMRGAATIIELFLRQLPAEEQAEYRKTLPDFKIKTKDCARDSRKVD